jgi:serine/threonine protein kinase
VIMGAAAYMPPEQASGKTADRRADIWSFRAVLDEMLAGQRAFAGESVSDARYRCWNGSHTRLSERNYPLKRISIFALACGAAAATLLMGWQAEAPAPLPLAPVPPMGWNSWDAGARDPDIERIQCPPTPAGTPAGRAPPGTHKRIP